MGIFASKMLVTIEVWTLVQNVIAIVVGAWLYKEGRRRCPDPWHVDCPLRRGYGDRA